jgi:hypothetical protein
MYTLRVYVQSIALSVCFMPASGEPSMFPLGLDVLARSRAATTTTGPDPETLTRDGPSPGRSEMGFGRDRLDPVAESELLQDAGDVGFRRCFADHELLADLGVGQPSGEQLQHFTLPSCEVRDSRRRRDRGRGSVPGELLDHGAGHGGREEGVAAGDDPRHRRPDPGATVGRRDGDATPRPPVSSREVAGINAAMGRDNSTWSRMQKRRARGK